jgi:hypothetical protein
MDIQMHTPGRRHQVLRRADDTVGRLRQHRHSTAAAPTSLVGDGLTYVLTACGFISFFLQEQAACDLALICLMILSN